METKVDSPLKIKYDIYTVLPESRHPDLEYLSETNFSDILSLGLAVLYEEKPNRPITFLSNWLLKFGEENKSKDKVLPK